SPTAIYPLSLHDALPIWTQGIRVLACQGVDQRFAVVEMSDLEWSERSLVNTQLIEERPLQADRAEPLADRQAGRAALDVLGEVRSEEHTSELQSLRHLVC